MTNDPRWQYVVRRDEMRQTAEVIAHLASKPVPNRIGTPDVMALSVSNANGKPSVLLGMGDAFNACRENSCTVAMRTDVSPLEDARLLSFGTDHAGFLDRAEGKGDMAELLTRAHMILLEVGVVNEGRRVVRFETDTPLSLPLPPIPTP